MEINAGTQVGTLDEAYRPTKSTAFGVLSFGAASNKFGLIQINTGGGVHVFNYTSSATVYGYGSVSYCI